MILSSYYIFFFSSRRRHTRCLSDWSSDVCSSDLLQSKIQAVTSGDCAAPSMTAWILLCRRETSGTWASLIRLSTGGAGGVRSEERRVGKEGRGGWSAGD